jgi:hypothetical protein
MLLPDLFRNPQRLKAQRVNAYENRFDALRKILPPRGVVGYFSNCTDYDGNYTARWYVAQYALAPVIVAHSSGHQLVVGNFCTVPPDFAAITGSGLNLIKDFGNGVMLFSKEMK